MEDPILLMMIIFLVIVKIALTNYYGHKINYLICPKSSESNIVFFILMIFISGDLDPTAAEHSLQHRGLVLHHLPEAGILGVLRTGSVCQYTAVTTHRAEIADIETDSYHE